MGKYRKTLDPRTHTHTHLPNEQSVAMEVKYTYSVSNTIMEPAQGSTLKGTVEHPSRFRDGFSGKVL